MFASANAFAAALLASLFLTPVVRDLAIRMRMVDAGGVRKIHEKSTPRVGGVAFVSIFYLVIAAVLAFDAEMRLTVMAYAPRSFAFLLGGGVIALLGLADDLRGVRARHKLLVQLLVAGGLCWAGFTVRDIELPTGAVLHLGAAGVPLTMLWIAGVMNAMNLIDGLDGLAGGIAEIALAAVLVMCAALGKPVVAMFSAALAGAVLGFLFYNFNPASIFMGDTGSLFLGYFLGVSMLVAGHQRGDAALHLAVPFAVLAIPVGDTMLAMARRAVRGRGLFSPDRNHLHHRLLARGLSQRKAVIVLYLASAGFCAAALAIWFGGVRVDLAACAAVVVAAGWMFWKLGLFDQLDVRGTGQSRSRNRSLNASIDAIAGRLQHATNLVDVLDSVHELSPVVRAARIKTRLGPLSTEVGALGEPERVVSMRFVLGVGAYKLGHVEVAWADGRTEVDEDHALAIERLCEKMASIAHRLDPNLGGLETPAEMPVLIYTGRRAG